MINYDLHHHNNNIIIIFIIIILHYTVSFVFCNLDMVWSFIILNKTNKMKAMKGVVIVEKPRAGLSTLYIVHKYIYIYLFYFLSMINYCTVMFDIAWVFGLKNLTTNNKSFIIIYFKTHICEENIYLIFMKTASTKG